MSKKSMKKKYKNAELLRFQPNEFAEAKEMAKELRKGNVLVVDFENTRNQEILRIIDFLTGVLFILGGKHKKITTKTYLLSPSPELLEKFASDLY